jgi:hypothetical protein
MKIPALMQDGKYLIDVTNPVIVNGLQTTNVLYEHYLKHPNSLNGVFVVVRVYETDDETLIDLITDATNTQTAIDFRDKLSNKPFMLQIKAFFELHNVAFITKRGEAFRNFYQETVFETSIENDAALRNWYRYFIEENGILEPERSVMEEFFEANRNTLHPLHLFLYTCIDNFASQIFWVNRLIRICENELKRQEIPLFRKRKFRPKRL